MACILAGAEVNVQEALPMRQALEAVEKRRFHLALTARS